MSLQRALQKLRTQRNDNEDNQTPLSANGGLVNKPVESVSCYSFEDINFSDEYDDFPMEFFAPTASTVATPTKSTVATPSNEKTRFEQKRIPLVATPTSLSRLNHQSFNRQSGTNNNKRKTNKNNYQPHPLTTPTTSSSLSTPIANFHQRFPGPVAKFPGPAGRLPQLVSGQAINNNIVLLPPVKKPSPLTTPRRKRLTINSPTNIPSHDNIIDNEFSIPPWTTMMKQLNLSDPINNHLSKYTISYVKQMANNQLLVGGKIPHLRVLIKSICCTTKNISALVKDETGEILAIVHMKVWDEYKEDWVQGCCMILRQVTVLSPTPRKHYLNITLDNIVRLYPVIQNGQSFTTMPKLNSARNDLISLGIEKLHDDSTDKPVAGPCTTQLLSGNDGHYINKDSSYIQDPAGTSSLCTRASNSSTGPSHLSTGPSGLNTGPSSSSTGPFSMDIDDEFDAFFNGIDVSSLDV